MTIAMQPIYTQTASGSAAVITFNNIPQTFTDLLIEVSARSSNASNDSFFMQCGTSLGFDSAAVYSQTRLGGDGAGVWSDRQTGQSWCFTYATVPATNGTSNTFGSAQIYVPNYISSNFKSFILNAVSERSATTGNNIEQMLHADLWRNTNALTSVKFQLLSGSNFAANSTITIYGITKG
jgi:hypothetical protein